MNALRLIFGCILLLTGWAWSQVVVPIGTYRVSVASQPAQIPVGRVKLFFTVLDASGKPVEGAKVTVLTEMPGMKMGEKEEAARPKPGQIGVYEAPAAFPMGGEYRVVLTIQGVQGEFKLHTGQLTTGSKGWPVGPIALLLAAGLLGLGLWRTGSRPRWSKLKDPQILGSLVLLALMLAVAVYAVRNWRRPGAMTPIEAQVMDMSMPAPSGALPVKLEPVRRGSVAETVRYSGQVVGYNEQVITARVTGIVEWMTAYPGDRVVKGQLLARLDTSQTLPQVQEREAAWRVSQQKVVTAEAEATQAEAEVSRTHAELRGQRAAVDESQDQVQAAQAQLRKAQAEVLPRREQYRRSKLLLAQGAVSQEEFERDQADWRVAQAAAEQARADLSQMQARLRQSESAEHAHHAHVHSSQGAFRVAQAKIAEAHAGQDQASAALQSAQAELGYTRLVAPADGMITQRVLSPGTLAKPGDVLLHMAELDPIRLQANVSEQDLARIRLGQSVSVTDASGGPAVSGKVTSIYPAVDSASRTGIVETLLPNPKHRFLPGAFVTLDVAVSRSQGALYVPTPAVIERNLSSKETVYQVWVAEQEDAKNWLARPVNVRLGATNGQSTAIVQGVQEGWQVIVSGQQFLTLGQAVTPIPSSEVEAPGPITVEVTGRGYQPASVSAVAGRPLKMVFIRRTEQTCGTEVIFPDYKINKPLPLNQPVEIEITPRAAGTIRFTCGMDMFEGKVVVK